LYLNKVVVADFDGICSPHIWALETKNGLMQELLPFYMLTKTFFEYTNANAAGTMSKYLGWEEMSSFKINLPPIDEQKQISIFFKSIETALEQLDSQEKNLENLKKRLIDDLAIKENDYLNSWRNLNNSTWREVDFGDFVDHIEKNERNTENRKIAKYVSVENIVTGKLKIQSFVKEEMPTFSRTFKIGDILFAKRRAYQRKVAIADFDGICSPHIWALQSKSGLIQDYLAYIMLSDTFYIYANANSAGTMSVYLKWPQLSKYKMLLPSIEQQTQILEIFKNIENVLNKLDFQKITLRNLKRKLLNEILG
jgi:type I restriction enzyme S subunit